MIEEVPEKLVRPGKCSMVEIDGQAGIMTRWGYWFNLNARYSELT